MFVQLSPPGRWKNNSEVNLCLAIVEAIVALFLSAVGSSLGNVSDDTFRTESKSLPSVRWDNAQRPLSLSISSFAEFTSQMTVGRLLSFFLLFLFSSRLLFVQFHGNCLLSCKQNTVSPLFAYSMFIGLNSGRKTFD
jgi:hypothetical protein